MTEKAEAKKPLWRRVLRVALTVLCAAVLLGVFYLAVVLGQPEEPEYTLTVDQTQPLLTASPALTITDESQLSTLMAGFPAPALSMMSGYGPVFKSGMCYDQMFENGFGRLLALTYTNEGAEYKVLSIYPARALSMLGKGSYTLIGAASQTLGGLKTVRMEDASTIRLHAQAADAIYVFTVPKMSEDSLTTLVRALQLTTLAETP